MKVIRNFLPQSILSLRVGNAGTRHNSNTSMDIALSKKYIISPENFSPNACYRYYK
ncbi:hypothetical protein CHELA20_11667 [Hyphomicrobiales bacterium]|nr:hypothetical protein CHELA20_11667 [Hyphomicrobiales bacterium]CAH1689487.1 hypothetical protein CHELA41_50121 [Hyphomicrobiales bacterium]